MQKSKRVKKVHQKKNQSNTKGGSIGGIEKKLYRTEENSKMAASFTISNHFECKWIKLTN